MKLSFRQDHIFRILAIYEGQKKPLDGLLRQYFRANKSVGSKDRKFIADTLYDLVRWRGLLDFFCQKPSWEERVFLYFEKFSELRKEKVLPHVQVSFPKNYFDALLKHFSLEKVLQFCSISNTLAPVTIRTNPLKISREDFLRACEGKYEISPCKISPFGIVFHRKVNFFDLQEFRKGWFEIQDEGSQLIAHLVDAKPGESVLDFCAGSGGKTLAFAHKMERKGQIYLHDRRAFILQEAKKRLRRAGIQNAQVVLPEELRRKGLKGRMDWILLDVPCSGSGTLRRNPDMKWNFTEEMVLELAQIQKNIFAEALPFLKKGGKIVYTTCSVFPEENQAQIEFFLKQYDLELFGDILTWFPEKEGRDGFFGAVMQEKK